MDELEILKRFFLGSPGRALGGKAAEAAQAANRALDERDARFHDQSVALESRSLQNAGEDLPYIRKMAESMDIPAARSAMGHKELEHFAGRPGLGQALPGTRKPDEHYETQLILRILGNAKRRRPDAQRLAPATHKNQAL